MRVDQAPMRIAVPITATTMDDALRDIDEACKHPGVSILELRIDFMQNPNLERLLRHSSKPAIVTPRAKQEGGKFEGSEARRIAYIQEAISLRAAYVDMEGALYQKLEGNGFTKFIISAHDFEKTPYLPAIAERLDGKGHIIKIATKALSKDDALRMLFFTKSYTGRGKDMIGICMGDQGRDTRFRGPSFGSYLTFATLDPLKASASHQPSVDELRAYEKSKK